MSDSVEAKLYEDVPTGEPFEPLWNWDETPAGRLMMVDREQTLVSVIVPGDQSEQSGALGVSEQSGALGASEQSEPSKPSIVTTRRPSGAPARPTS